MVFDLQNLGSISSGGVKGFIYNLLLTPLFWGLIILIVIVGAFGILFIRKKRTLKFPLLEVTEYGIYNGKAGWFGINSYLNGLLWSGRKVMKTDDGVIVNNFEEGDFVEINNRRGVLCYRDPLDGQLYPLKTFVPDKAEFSKIRTKVPPRELRDTASEIIKQADKETQDKLQKVLQFVAWALIVLVSLVAIIVITKMVESGQTRASELIVEAGETCLSNAKEICSQILNERISTTAP